MEQSMSHTGMGQNCGSRALRSINSGPFPVHKYTFFLIILVEKSPMPAKFRGSSFLLTYPQSDFPLQSLLDHLISLDVRYAKLCSERHNDGSLHRHALVHFATTIQVGSRHFDFEQRHPNVRTVGRKRTDWENVSAYVGKDGEILEYGTPRHAENASVWSAIVGASSRSEAEQILRTEKPRDAVLNSRNFDYFLDKMFPLRENASGFQPRSPSEFCVPVEIDEWLSESFW